MTLNSKKIPWVSSIKHLGVTITNVLNDMNQDILENRTQYIAKNNELMQEFYFADSTTLARMNNILNTHFYGAPLWDLFSSDFEKLENHVLFTSDNTQVSG